MRGLWLLLLWSMATVAAAEAPRIAIIIDDIGDRYEAGSRAVALPGPITYSFLPHTPHAARLARQAHAKGSEVMLHLPMQAQAGNKLGPGALTLHMSERQLREVVRSDLAALPFVAGINNHMGSLLTRHPGHMDWLMSEVNAQGGLYFVDSVTTGATVAASIAEEHGLPSTRRDIFLDSDPGIAAVRRQFARLVAAARQQGTALAIGHPYPETLAALEELLPRLDELGIQLVPVSRLIAARQERSTHLWQASLSPSPTAAKNSKP